jgi:hypothetical protein
MDEIISYKMCAVKVRNAKLRNYLNRGASDSHMMMEGSIWGLSQPTLSTFPEEGNWRKATTFVQNDDRFCRNTRFERRQDRELQVLLFCLGHGNLACKLVPVIEHFPAKFYLLSDQSFL